MRNPPDLSIDIPDLLHVSLGPTSVFRVRRCDPRFAFRGPWACAFTAVHPTPVASGDHGVLARGAFTRFCMAPLARPVGAELIYLLLVGWYHRTYNPIRNR